MMFSKSFGPYRPAKIESNGLLIARRSYRELEAPFARDPEAGRLTFEVSKRWTPPEEHQSVSVGGITRYAIATVLIIIGVFWVVAADARQSNLSSFLGRDPIPYCLRYTSGKEVCKREQVSAEWDCEEQLSNILDAICNKWDESLITQFCLTWTEGVDIYGKPYKEKSFFRLNVRGFHPRFACIVSREEIQE